MNEIYRKQVELLLKILPYIGSLGGFALKGGTAINLFIWDLPRLSVDIDLTYIGMESREDALANISTKLGELRSVIERNIQKCQVNFQGSGGTESKLVCSTPNATIKIEVNTTIRGTAFPTRTMSVVQSVENEFGLFAELDVISQAELFGGKICAALDRQHPRDIFDVRGLFEANGVTRDVIEGTIISILSHPRPIHEMLCPNQVDQISVFDTQFQGMALRPFSYSDFEKTRSELFRNIIGWLNQSDREFLLSFKSGNPDWSLWSNRLTAELPAVKWKLFNIHRLSSEDPSKHKNQMEKLRALLG